MSDVIGMDIGGTHTDAVLVNSTGEIIAKHKTWTTTPLEIGALKAIEQLLLHYPKDRREIEGLFIGTTHATNAILECQDLFRVGVIRLSGQRPQNLDCCYFWPENLYKTVFTSCITIDGGYRCDGKEINAFDRKQAEMAAKQLVEEGAEAIAIVGAFSPIFNAQEIACQEAVSQILGPDFPISLSHQIGGIGFIERENATVLNAALKKTMGIGFKHLEQIKIKCGLSCPLWITQNDGSILDIQEAINFPLLTLSSGPTNSFVGASKLSQVQDAIIVDIGGTSTDIGMIKNGYPRRSMHNVNIGGVVLNFRMPDVLALSIGGGSYVDLKGDAIIIGPKSSGKNLKQEAQVFGGDTLTLTDAAIAAGCLSIKDGKNVRIPEKEGKRVIALMQEKIEYGISKMKGNNINIPIVIVGGGAPFMSFLQPENVFFPKHFDVANAYGSALAEISFLLDTTVSLSNREATLTKLKEEAIEAAIKKGADPSRTNIVDVTIWPYHYMPGELARVVIKASGKRMQKNRPITELR